MEISEHRLSDESDSDEYDSDDSQEDPSFDFVEETRLSFSNLGVKKKTRARIVKGADKENGEDSDEIKLVVPELNEKDQKSYEAIQKIIEGGEIQKLKVDQLKIYLRKHGLRLSGNKDTLLQRIKEHIDIVNGGGEKRYPASSFVMNCKGDACMGDVVMFEQNVYEMFNIASRCGNGPPLGTRVIAGRIVKESYGAAKQQHTFTIEVLWSKGEKPLPPLHPLLIKGRNLYRLKTMRQKWEDETERQKIVSEKHARGGVARLNRDARIQKREERNMQKLKRVTVKDQRDRKQETQLNQTTQQQRRQIYESNDISNANVPTDKFLHRKPLFGLNSGSGSMSSQSQVDFHYNQNFNYNNYSSRPPNQGPVQRDTSQENWRRDHMSQAPQQTFAPYKPENINGARNNPPLVPVQGREQRQICRYFPQGTCYYGERCKYLHK